MEERETRRTRGLATRQGGEDPIDCNGGPRQGAHPAEDRRCLSRVASCRAGKRSSLPRGDHPGLLSPLEDVAVITEPLDRFGAPAPAHRIGKIQAQPSARKVERPPLGSWRHLTI